MRKFYNQSITKIEELEDYKTKEFELDVPSLYGILYFEEVDAAIQAFVKDIQTAEPILIKIIGDFDLLEEAEERDKLDFIDTILSLFVDAIIDKEAKTKKERHLLINKALSGINVNEFTKRKIRNHKSKFDLWNIVVLNKENKKVVEVF